MNLERKKLVISGFWGHSRHWETLERATAKERRWASRRSEDQAHRREAWQWGWFVRRLPEDLRIKYKLRILKDEDIKELERRRIDYYRTKILPSKEVREV